MPMEDRGGLKATTVKQVTNLLSLYPHSFCYFLFLSARVLLSLAGYARNHFSTFWTLWTKASLNFEEQPGQLTELSLLFHKTNLRKIEAHQSTSDFVDNNYLAYYTVILCH